MRYLLLILFSLSIYSAKAQDANYWSAAYNPAGILNPGSAVASTRDSGVLYFNPALLAYNTRNSATISGSIYQFNSLGIKNGAGDGLNLKSTNVSIVPVMASGVLAIKGKKSFSIGYAIINDPVMNFKANQQRDGKFNVLSDTYSPGDEVFIGQFSGQSTINETTGILSTGFKIANRLAFGLGVLAQYRTQHIVESYSGRVLINTGTTTGLPPITNIETAYEVSHYNVSMKFRAGLAYDLDHDHLGVTVSSPLSKIKSNGQLLSDNVVSNLRLSPTDTLNFLATSRQTKLSETWKMPFSVAFGYSHDLDWGQIYVSTEYFTKVNEYNILTPRADNFLHSAGADNSFTSDLLKFKDARKSVTNFGFGITYNMRPDLVGFIAARTDYTYANDALYKDDNGYSANTSQYNIYHLQLGSSIKKRKFNLRTGLLIDYGHTSSFPQAVNLSNPNEGNFLTGDTHNTKASYFSVGIMFAYVHNL